MAGDSRTRVLYLAPWVDFGGSDKGTIDWFRWLDRDRFAASLMTTQPSANRRLAEIVPYAEEVWPLPDLMGGQHMPEMIFDFIATRGIEVVHVMNARIGYELLADMAALPRPPKVVVQLHVEEEDRSGYVRLVSRRYGNLVHGFSVSSQHLARVVEGYDIASSRLHVIPTGVDAEEEFDPSRVSPVEGLEPGAVHVLCPGRLVVQKDPLLTVEVAALAVAERPDLRFHLVGEGVLEPDVRAAIRRHGLEQRVLLHPPTPRLAPWYAACDVLLMTSRFEGVPYVAYEAMAMGVPVVAPALAGNLELLGSEAGALIEPRDDAGAYARALVRLAGDAEQRAAIGARSRERCLGELSVRTMARAHERLYDVLLGESLISGVDEDAPDPGGPPLVDPDRRGAVPSPAALPPRTRGTTPRVSVIVPCFNHGRYLPECLAAIRDQEDVELEIIVIDDASTDTGTIAVLEELERDGATTVLRMPDNGGPSRARNAGLDRATGDYLLPVDADNLLLPGVARRMVEQLRAAPLDVGFIYPSLQYFGNRRDMFEAPEYNLFGLLEGNTCDTCSLFDATPFREGLRFAEDIKLGHEDWDLILQLAARGIRGEPARFPTLLYRKSGFTRSDSVEYMNEAFHEAIRSRHPELFGAARFGRWGLHGGPAVSIKARWSPGLSIIALAPLTAEHLAELDAALDAQTCADIEVLVRCDAELPARRRGGVLRRIPTALATDAAGALADGIRAARAPYVLVTEGDGRSLLRSRSLVEQLERSVVIRPLLEAVGFVDAGDAGRYDLRLLEQPELEDRHPHAFLWRRDGRRTPPVESVTVDADAPLRALAAAWQTRLVQWRHLRRPDAPAAKPCGRQAWVRTGPPPPRHGHERVERRERMARPPALPALAWDAVRRWTFEESWRPPETLALVRHRRDGGDERIVTNSRRPPDGYVIDYDLGSIQHFQPPGTAELRRDPEVGYRALEDEDEGAPRLRAPRDEETLGFLEQAPLPLFDGLAVGHHRPTGQWVLVSGAADPLADEIEDRRHLGFIEAFPNHPRLPRLFASPYGAVPLLRAVDIRARRHRYAIGRPPAGELSLELGALHREPRPGSVPLRLDAEGAVVGADAPRRDPTAYARWVLAPLRWSDMGALTPRLRASARRAAEAVLAGRGRAHSSPNGAPAAGYLFAEEGPGRRPLYLAVHPVTGDQLLTPWPNEAADMGYGSASRLGWLSAAAPVTGSLDARPIDVPWASRFARQTRHT